jgi:hypothetical protein
MRIGARRRWMLLVEVASLATFAVQLGLVRLT